MSQHLNIHTHQKPAQKFRVIAKHTKTNREKTHLRVIANIKIVGRFKLLVGLKSNFNKCDNMLIVLGIWEVRNNNPNKLKIKWI